MKTYTIQQKQSNTGSIYDIASDTHDIVLRFRDGVNYAIVLPSYYNARPAYAADAQTAARKARKEMRDGYMGVCILDTDGNDVTCLILNNY